MTFIANAAHLAANGTLAVPAEKLRGAFRRLFASDWAERWMVIVNDHAVGTLSRDADGVSLTWFEPFDKDLPELASKCDTSLAELHQEIARKLGSEPRRVVFLPIGE
jgi:hypothetical protein